MADDESPEIPEPQAFTDLSPSPADDPELAILCDALQECGVTRVVIRYEGCGDSGSIEEVEHTPGISSLPAWIENELREVAENYCPDGYENNEGGYGTLTLYPGLGLAELEHCDRYEDTEDMDIEAVALPAELQRQLSQLGVTGLTVHFDGYGDSGQLEEFAVQPASIVLDSELEAELENFLLDQLPGGWENNEGAFGDFTVNVATGQVVVDAYGRVEKDSDPEVTRWHWRQ